MKLNLEADPNFYDHVHSPEEFDREDKNKQAVEAFRAEVASSVMSAKKKLKEMRKGRKELIESGVEGFLFDQTMKGYNSLIGTCQFLLKQQEITLSRINQILEEWQ